MKKITPDILNLDGKTAILTGSAGRIGHQFSHALSAAGANVILVDIEEQKNKKLEKELKKKYYTKPFSLTIDITNEKEVKKLNQIVLKKYKKIDILVNNAHYSPRTHPSRDAPFEKFPLDLWEKIVHLNLTSIFLCSREIGKTMLKQKKGVIVNISSIYGMVGADQRIYGKTKLNSPAHYATVKGGIVNLTRYLAACWGRKNIRVNTLTLGALYDTYLHKDKTFVKNYEDRTILGRMARKNDFDGALLFLASDASNYMTGANLVIDGGWTAW